MPHEARGAARQVPRGARQDSADERRGEEAEGDRAGDEKVRLSGYKMTGVLEGIIGTRSVQAQNIKCLHMGRNFVGWGLLRSVTITEQAVWIEATGNSAWVKPERRLDYYVEPKS